MSKIERKYFRRIFILESREFWSTCQELFNPEDDLVLTYDFGLRIDIEKLGGQVFYLDHLKDKSVMQENNFLVYDFFRDWIFNSEGRDIFVYRDIPFGFSFRLEIWNELIFFARTWLCMTFLREVSFETLYVGSHDSLVLSVLREMQFEAQVLQALPAAKPTYFFPIFKWFEEQVRPKGFRGFKRGLRTFATAVQGEVMNWIDRALGRNSNRKTIFIQEYHPTRSIIRRLQRHPGLNVVLSSFSSAPGPGKLITERVIPIWGPTSKFDRIAIEMLEKFRRERSAKLVLSNGDDISSLVYRMIEKRVSAKIRTSLRNLDCIIRFMDRVSIELIVLIANIGEIPTLVDCVGKHRGIPSYLIINGLLTNAFLDEAKYATVINSYSESIKEHYFRGMNNIVPLGDPRMDSYQGPRRTINRDSPTISIGASGHNNLDLNSYLAVEFAFLHDVLVAIRGLMAQGAKFHVILKVRANGYKAQYEQFIVEFFPDVPVEILDTVPMKSFLEKSDLYVSFYSQTHFEASCMGIPCIYYKKDTEIIDTPFDERSELTTVSTIEELSQAIRDFQTDHPRYAAFLDKANMQKYVGPLDGGNLDRNVGFIHTLLSSPYGS